MDPISMGLGIAGLGIKLAGAFSSMGSADEAHQIQQQISGQEQLLNEQRHRAMVLSAQRQNLEILRTQQRARAIALTNASGQGAQYGSGLQGGYGQIAGQTNNNLLGLSQNYEIGENTFGINNKISGLKSQLSDVNYDMSVSQGISSLGGSIGSSADTIGKLYKNFGGG